MNKKLSKLEALRGLAALYVVFHHTFTKGLFVAGKDISFLFRFGQEAVILFFVLSGFVIQYAYSISKDKTFSLFFIKRFFRIYIPLTLVFITNYLLFFLSSSNDYSFSWATLAGNLLMLQDIGAFKPNVICDPFLGNTPLWSLSYEWWFYMLFFFIQQQWKHKSSGVVYLLGITATISYCFFPFFINRILMYLVIWWVGADMAKCYLEDQKVHFSKMKVALSGLFICVLILGLNYWLNRANFQLKYALPDKIGVSPALELRHFAFAFFVSLGALGWQNLNWKFFDQTVGLFTPLASVSFGVYISHWFLISRASYLDGIVESSIVRFLLYFLICLLFAYIVERIIYVRLNKMIITYFRKKADRKEIVAIK